jgi:hypothetical protein
MPTTKMPIRSEIRVPWMTLAKISRPRLSVPNKNCALGNTLSFIKSVNSALGITIFVPAMRTGGDITSAKMAQKTINRMMTSPAMAVLLLLKRRQISINWLFFFLGRAGVVKSLFSLTVSSPLLILGFYPRVKVGVQDIDQQVDEAE